jgi:hypothetical protein
MAGPVAVGRGLTIASTCGIRTFPGGGLNGWGPRVGRWAAASAAPNGWGPKIGRWL